MGVNACGEEVNELTLVEVKPTSWQEVKNKELKKIRNKILTNNNLSL